MGSQSNKHFVGMNAHYLFIPDNLDIDSHLATYNFTRISGFNKDRLYFILSLISEIPSYNKDVIIDDGYVPINAQMLRKWVPESEKYIQCLLQIGVLETNGVYTVGKRSKGYRFTPQYKSSLRKQLVTDLHLHHTLENRRFVNEVAEIMNRQSMVQSTQSATCYGYVQECYQMAEIRISEDATEYNEDAYKYKIQLQDKSRWDRVSNANGTYKLKDPYLQYIAGVRNIDRIQTGNYGLHNDTNVYRMHSAITNCKKELRNFITFQNSTVGAVDISNSQPTLLLALLNKSFLDGTAEFNSNTVPYFNTTTLSTDTNPNSLIMLLEKSQDNEVSRDEYSRYRDMVVSGRFYDEFATLIAQKVGITYTRRDDLKAMIFTVLFTSNKFINGPDAAPKRLFRDIFPNIYNVLAHIKKDEPNLLPILLQRIESYIMYYRIVPRIARERPDLPIIPIHDSIASIGGNENYIESVMKEEIEACIGTTPHFKRELWTPYNLGADYIKNRA